MAINRYNQPVQSQYVSQYADYKLPYAAIQNAAMQRQARFDQNQMMAAQSATKFGQLDSRMVDAEGKDAMIQGYLDDVHGTVENKYGGDYSLAAGDILRKTSEFTSRPEWTAMKRSLEDEGIYKQARAQAIQNNDVFYDKYQSKGNRSIFGEDGTTLRDDYQDNRYDYVVMSPAEDRALREQYFNNKEIDASSNFSIDELNKMAEMGDKAFMQYYETEYRKFDEDYINEATSDYIRSNPAQYQIYLDKALKDANGNMEEALTKAEGLVKRDMELTAKEYKVNRNLARAQANPGWVAPSDRGGDDPKHSSEYAPFGVESVVLGKDQDGDQILNMSTYDETMSNIEKIREEDPVKAERLETVSDNLEDMLMRDPVYEEAFNTYQTTRKENLPQVKETATNYFTSFDKEAGLTNTQIEQNQEIYKELLDGMFNLNNPKEEVSPTWERFKNKFFTAAKIVSAALNPNSPMGVIKTAQALTEQEVKKEDILRREVKSLGTYDDDQSVEESIDKLNYVLQTRPEIRKELGLNSVEGQTLYSSYEQSTGAGAIKRGVNSMFGRDMFGTDVDDIAEANNNENAFKAIGKTKKRYDYIRNVKGKKYLPKVTAYETDKRAFRGDPDGDDLKSLNAIYKTGLSQLVSAEDLKEFAEQYENASGEKMSYNDMEKYVNGVVFDNIEDLIFSDDIDGNVKASLRLPLYNIESGEQLSLPIKAPTPEIQTELNAISKAAGTSPERQAVKLERFFDGKIKDPKTGDDMNPPLAQLTTRTGPDRNLYLAEKSEDGKKNLMTYGNFIKKFANKYKFVPPEILKMMNEYGEQVMEEPIVLMSSENGVQQNTLIGEYLTMTPEDVNNTRIEYKNLWAKQNPDRSEEENPFSKAYYTKNIEQNYVK